MFNKKIEKLYLKMTRIIADANYIDAVTLDAKSEAKVKRIEKKIYELINRR
ncbi:MAG: hypothetical protein Q4F11_10520 [Eubacteriales bacterium]|nr:hypothetical protein [Eubacteriales bacterium]